MSTNAITVLNNTIAFIDQALSLSMRSNGREHSVQCTRVYNRDIAFDGLRRLNDDLAHGLLGRRIERSALPFGRHRWVAAHTPPDIDIAPTASRDQLSGWVNARAEIPTIAEFGQVWHLGVLPMGDDGTAVTLVASHSVIDAVGLCLADAVRGARMISAIPRHARAADRRRCAMTPARPQGP